MTYLQNFYQMLNSWLDKRFCIYNNLRILISVSALLDCDICILFNQVDEVFGFIPDNNDIGGDGPLAFAVSILSDKRVHLCFVIRQWKIYLTYLLWLCELKLVLACLDKRISRNAFDFELSSITASISGLLGCLARKVLQRCLSSLFTVI